MNQKKYLLIAVILVFILGAGYIVYSKRPVMELKNQTPSQASNTTTPSTGSESTANAGNYAMSDVTSHSTEASCWTAIDGDVYDLTTWVSRHPGGADKIIQLCGTDGSSLFKTVHGGNNKAKKALILLKIGSLT